MSNIQPTGPSTGAKSGSQLSVVTLKNGSQEALPLVQVTMLSLRSLIDSGDLTDVLALSDLVQIARREITKPFSPEIGKRLTDLNLATATPSGSWNIHDSTRNIILSAAEGSGFELQLTNPIRR